MVENLFLSPPKSPSIAELSGLQSLFNIDLVRWFFSQIAIQPG